MFQRLQAAKLTEPMGWRHEGLGFVQELAEPSLSFQGLWLRERCSDSRHGGCLHVSQVEGRFFTNRKPGIIEVFYPLFHLLRSNRGRWTKALLEEGHAVRRD